MRLPPSSRQSSIFTRMLLSLAANLKMMHSQAILVPTTEVPIPQRKVKRIRNRSNQKIPHRYDLQSKALLSIRFLPTQHRHSYTPHRLLTLQLGKKRNLNSLRKSYNRTTPTRSELFSALKIASNIHSTLLLANCSMKTIWLRRLMLNTSSKRFNRKHRRHASEHYK